MAKKYEVTIKESKGSCTKPLFEKMVKNGDITAEKISDVVGKVVKIDGFADCHVVAGDKEFDITYYATSDGLISSGSEVFKQSVLNYMDENVMCKIMKIKTNKGTTFKCSPILVDDESGEVQDF